MTQGSLPCRLGGGTCAGPFGDLRLMADRIEYDPGGNTPFTPPCGFQIP